MFICWKVLRKCNKIFLVITFAVLFASVIRVFVVERRKTGKWLCIITFYIFFERKSCKLILYHINLHRVFHGIRFKVNKWRMVVVRQPFLFYISLSPIIKKIAELIFFFSFRYKFLDFKLFMLLYFYIFPTKQILLFFLFRP